MNVSEHCNDRFEDIVAFVMGELDHAAAAELQDHISQCDECRAAHDILLEEEKEVRSGFEALARSLNPIEQAVLGHQQHQATVRINVSNNHFLKRVKNMFITHKRLSVAAAATAMALAASLVLYVTLFSSPTAAYALEQTVQAIKNVISYHVKITPAAELGEAWVQLKPDGSPLQARMDLLSPHDGPKVVVLSDGKAEVWFKKKNSFVIVRDKKALKRLMKMRAIFDPKLAFEELQAAQRAGKTQVVTKEPVEKGDPVTLTVTSKATPDRREVYEVDPKTKLVQRVTTYDRHDGQWEQVEQREYLDYNKVIDPKVFKPELPKDVMKIDDIKRPPGLVKGDLTDEQIATKVAREFFEALIAKDYKKAGLIYSGIPAKKMEELFGRHEFNRIVEIGKPKAGLHPDPTALAVPVKVEWGMSSPQKMVKPVDVVIQSTDAATAKKAVREAFEALLREDYAAALQILKKPDDPQKGHSAADIKSFEEGYKRNKYLRIVEIGEPVPDPKTGTSKVPVKIELEVKSFKGVRQFRPYIRPVHGQPDRWNICGGI